MSWITQGRKEHGHFGDGRADKTSVPTYTHPAQALPAHQVGHPGAASRETHGHYTIDPHETNVEDLARVIMSEAGGQSDAEKAMVGQVLMKRLHRAPPDWTVKQVWRGLAHRKAPTEAELALARRIIDGHEPDIAQGATHFYSPDRMPKKGDPTGNADIGGGLEWSVAPDGRTINNYKPGFAAQFPGVDIPGVDPKKFRVFKQPGNGFVR